MATTVLGAFDKFRQNLQITDLQTATVSRRQNSIRDFLSEEFCVTSSFLAGSYRRSTLIAPLSQADVDIFIVLDPCHFSRAPTAPANLLASVKKKLSAFFTPYTRTPDVSRNGQAVTVTYSEFSMDIVPCFNREGGGYIIPDGIDNQWISTDPYRHLQIWSETNTAKDGKFIPLVKMIKAWNKKHSSYLRSFHLETLVLYSIRYRTITDYQTAVRDVFGDIRTSFLAPVWDPAQYGGNIGDYISQINGLQNLENWLQIAYDQAVKAIEYDRAGYPADAIRCWKNIFHEYFPAYG